MKGRTAMNITSQWNQEERDLIRSKVIEYNGDRLTDEVKHPVKQVGFMVKDDNGIVFGGITGTIFWHHLHIDFLWVDEKLRGKGYGQDLVRQMEEAAKENQCRLIQLDSFSFQAPHFYQKLGYTVAGVVESHPTPEHQQYYLVKRLD